METTVLSFSNPFSGKEKSSSFPTNFEVISINSESDLFIDSSVFKSVVSFLANHNSLKLITICYRIEPNWNASTWNKHLKLAEEKGSSIFRSDNDSKKIEGLIPYVSTFIVSELRMAMDQNYRPNFEDIEEAYTTFGFRSTHFSPHN